MGVTEWLLASVSHRYTQACTNILLNNLLQFECSPLADGCFTGKPEPYILFCARFPTAPMSINLAVSVMEYLL